MYRRLIVCLLSFSLLFVALSPPVLATDDESDIVLSSFEHPVPDALPSADYVPPTTDDFLESLEYAPSGSAVRIDSDGNVSLVSKSEQTHMLPFSCTKPSADFENGIDM